MLSASFLVCATDNLHKMINCQASRTKAIYCKRHKNSIAPLPHLDSVRASTGTICKRLPKRRLDDPFGRGKAGLLTTRCTLPVVYSPRYLDSGIPTPNTNKINNIFNWQCVDQRKTKLRTRIFLSHISHSSTPHHLYK